MFEKPKSANQEPDLEQTMTPDQIRRAREEYAAVYGTEAFKTQPAARGAEPAPAVPAASTAEAPVREPYIEPENERTMTGEQMEELRRQYTEQESAQPQKSGEE